VDPRAEVTLEANPESVRPPLLQAWAEAGVNRLSIGAQSFDAEELLVLGRAHAAARPAGSFALARACGFRRLSLDLMFGFPRSNVTRLATTLERALALEPEHLSAYCYIPEPGTPLGDAVANGSVEVPGPDEQADSYALLSEGLRRAGYGCYETSNFCRAAGESRHNLVYWLRRPYVGLGPSAHGLLRGVRYGNHRTLARWAVALAAGQAPEAGAERETDASVAQEVMMLGLRLAGGLHPGDHAAPVWRAVRGRYGRAFEQALAAGRLERAGDAVRIPAALRFVADDVIAWIEAASERARFDSRAARFLPSITCQSQHSPGV
jgi:oxygen-independent coproporphyrinogen-3 oxidase